MAEIIRADGDGHSGDPSQLENYQLGFFVASYMELFCLSARGRTLLITRGEIQLIILSRVSLTRDESEQFCLGDPLEKHWARILGSFRIHHHTNVLVLPEGLGAVCTKLGAKAVGED